MIRGAVIHWYPYPFIDVATIGYGKAILNSFWVALLLLGRARPPWIHGSVRAGLSRYPRPGKPAGTRGSPES